MSHLTTIPDPREPIRLNVRGLIVTDEQSELLCRENPDLRLELTAQKELVIMPPTGFKTGRRNSRLVVTSISGQKQMELALSVIPLRYLHSQTEQSAHRMCRGSKKSASRH